MLAVARTGVCVTALLAAHPCLVPLWAQSVPVAPLAPVTPAVAQLAAARGELPQVEIDSFEHVWSTIRDSHWQQQPGGLDWDAIHREYRARMDQAHSREEARAITQQMLGRLQQTHFGILPAPAYAAVQPSGPDATAGPGSAGLDLRVLDGEAVVTSVEANSPAQRAGVRTGWIVSSINGEALRPLIEEAGRHAEIHELQLTRSLLGRLAGAPGEVLQASFLTGAGETPVAVELRLGSPRGVTSAFGNLPPSPVWYEARRLPSASGSEAFVQYVRFNLFLDIPRLMPAFETSVRQCREADPCRGLIIDLRGNPGGIGGMAMGMAGFLVDQTEQRLGTMYMREATLNFVINPRPPVYTGPLAILLDGSSASTSEIFAGGLQDLGRARIFGTRSAGAALPSVIERLPNGDGFQYALANYVSLGGLPLEGRGVTPDETVRLTRDGLLAGQDAVVDAAQAWIASQ